MKDQEEHCKSPCTIKEYKLEQIIDHPGHGNSILANFKFMLPAITRRHMTKKLLKKTIKTEHYVITELALLGNVGGILGIFVGLSFMGVSDWTITGFEKILRQNRHAIRCSTDDFEEPSSHAENVTVNSKSKSHEGTPTVLSQWNCHET